jgi:hypothetical protein
LKVREIKNGKVFMDIAVVSLIVSSAIGIAGIVAGFWLKKRDKKYNESLEEFKNDLLKENRVFSDKYNKTIELKNIINACKTSVNRTISHAKAKKKYGFVSNMPSTIIIDDTRMHKIQLDIFLDNNHIWLDENLQVTSKQVLVVLGRMIKQILAYDIDNVMVKREESRLKDIEIEFLDAIKAFNKEFLNFINNFQK